MIIKVQQTPTRKTSEKEPIKKMEKRQRIQAFLRGWMHEADSVDQLFQSNKCDEATLPNLHPVMSIHHLANAGVRWTCTSAQHSCSIHDYTLWSVCLGEHILTVRMPCHFYSSLASTFNYMGRISTKGPKCM